MGTSLDGETRRFSRVYVIYIADVGGSRANIKCMSPASHLPAGYTGLRKRVGEVVASRFALTEGDSLYERPDGDRGEGHHRKWVGELTRAEWLIFADRYIIELDSRGFPVDYEDTMGSLTEYGHLDAVAVDNSQGWESPGGPRWTESKFYISFGGPAEPES